MNVERREHPRLRLAFPVLLDGPHGLRRCVARDISSRGVFVQTADRYPPGCEIRVTFSLPDGSWELSVRCIVRHVVRLATRDGAMHGLGLSFEDIQDDLAETDRPTGRIHA